MDVPSIKSRRLSIGDTVTFPPFLTRNCYSIKDKVKYMVISNDLDSEMFPCAVITQNGELFFFHDYEVM